MLRDIKQSLHSIRDYVRLSMSQFKQANVYYGHGTDNAMDEAVALVLGALHLPFDLPGHFMGACLTDDEKDQVIGFIEKRIDQKLPVPYITNEAWFAELSFYIDQRALIPRSPMGELMAQQFHPWVQSDAVHAILDLCTGSGCIAIAAAYAFADATVDATDFSQEALSVAAINVDRHEMAHRVNLIQSDLFEQLPVKQYDLIMTNPPYVDEQALANMPPEYQHEPLMALEAGDDGLSMITSILGVAKNYLTEQGVLVAEVGASQPALIRRFPTVSFTWIELANGGEGVFVLTKQELARLS